MLLLNSKSILRSTFCVLFALTGSSSLFGQLNATFTKATNTKCNGSGCTYSGPTILINEIMMSPSSGDGSLSGSDASQRGEWIELYNPNLCEPVDISCYYLGSNVYVTGLFGTVTTDSREAFIIPAGTIIPPGGFCVVRGANATPVASNLLVPAGNTVEIVMPELLTGTGICVTGDTRFWFPNAGGWFGFYDRNGVPQDAVSWATVGGTNITGNCIPVVAGCNNTVTQLSSYDNFPSNRKTVVYSSGAVPGSWGRSIRRVPDGASWVTNAGTTSPTIGTCNDVCAVVGSSSCDGTATINVTGGTGPYTYLWNDSQAQLTQTATGLCAGTYICKVRDNGGPEVSFSVTIDNLVPTVSVSIVEEVCINAPAVSVTVSPVAGAGQTGALTGTGVTGTNFNPQTAGAGPHTMNYVYTDENGCTNSATDNITVNPQPVVSVSIVEQVCVDGAIVPVTVSPVAGAGQTGTLTGTGVTGTNFNPQVAGAGPHTMNYVFTDEKGCTNSTTDNITVNPLPVLAITGIDPTYCLSTTPINVTLQPAGGTLTGPGVANNVFVSANAGVGTHTLTYTYTDANSCTNTITRNVVVVLGPAPAFTVPAFLCNYAPQIPLTGTPAGGVFTIDGTQNTVFNPAAHSDGDHTIVYTVTDANNCIGAATETIEVKPRPALNLNLASPYCNYTTVVALTPSPAGGTLTGDFVSGTTLNLTTAAPGNYSITYDYTDANGCENTITTPFVYTAPVFPKFNYATDCFQMTTFFNETTPVGNYSYAWEVDNSPVAVGQHPTLYIETPGDHLVTLTATDSYNCSYDATQTAFIKEGLNMKHFVMPNVITPNGDGRNDTFTLPTMLDDCITYKIFIINRWGNVVYEMDGPGSAFAGRDKGGQDLLAGVYFYLVESEDFDCSSDEYKGFCSGMITIIRD